MKLTGISQKVFLDRYSLKDAKGNPVEKTPEQMWKRLAKAVAQQEKKETKKKWEKTFYDQQTPQTRKIALRMAITLGPCGILIPYFNLLKFGLGGRQASGKQMYSWVHIEDTCRMIEWIYGHKELNGIYNSSSPNP